MHLAYFSIKLGRERGTCTVCVQYDKPVCLSLHYIILNFNDPDHFDDKNCEKR